ncbi:MAG: ABC transporter permease [Candidatus Merdousia sp.]|nr:ABC transporter permease [Candidatus Merdousia sp.]
MIRYFAKRLLEAVPVFFAIITAVFFMVRFVPGGPFDSERPVPPETLAALDEYYGLNKPLVRQYASFLGNLARGELGPSFKYGGWSVGEILAEKAAVSLELGACALAVALAAGLALGFAAAAFSGTKFGGFLSGMSLLGICLPSFVLGPLLIMIFAMKLEWFNAMGWNAPSDIVLPSITLAFFYAAWIARLARNGALDERPRSYVRTAFAKGASRGRVYFVHILRNAVQPVVSYLGPAAAALLTGSFVVETIFQIPGLGRFFISSALDNDYTMIMGCVMLYSAFIIGFNLLSDLLLAAVNPRIAREMKK